MTPLAERARTREPTRFDVAGRIIRPAAGLLLVGLGVAGLIVPILPGIPLLVAGLALVAPEHRLVRPVRERLRSWFSRRDLAGLLLLTVVLAGAVRVHAAVDDALREAIEDQARVRGS